MFHSSFQPIPINNPNLLLKDHTRWQPKGFWSLFWGESEEGKKK
jgi:hypothetical protein